MGKFLGRKALPGQLAIDKAVLASSAKSGVKLLDCGEGHQGRYEVEAHGKLVACTDDYARARSYYFKETSRIRDEQKLAYNARLNEARESGLSGFWAQLVAEGCKTIAEALDAQRNACNGFGIPAAELPVNQANAVRCVTMPAGFKSAIVYLQDCDNKPTETIDHYDISVVVADELLDTFVAQLSDEAKAMFSQCADPNAESDGNSWGFFICRTDEARQALYQEVCRLNKMQKWAYAHETAEGKRG